MDVKYDVCVCVLEDPLTGGNPRAQFQCNFSKSITSIIRTYDRRRGLESLKPFVVANSLVFHLVDIPYAGCCYDIVNKSGDMLLQGKMKTEVWRGRSEPNKRDIPDRLTSSNATVSKVQKHLWTWYKEAFSCSPVLPWCPKFRLHMDDHRFLHLVQCPVSSHDELLESVYCDVVSIDRLVASRPVSTKSFSLESRTGLGAK
ncbi:unnamed protein product [Notodromas monacha]|uniref:Uncharacterized protein n=1 Tax=Notodromas monacha TaxID=399045 RepID=A0A7R9BIJ9_9CRUS|nr:unnamed protein product [Notodromas monacha]CAG0916161.1 unnamed protein product [Notodromas monacha]